PPARPVRSACCNRSRTLPGWGGSPGCPRPPRPAGAPWTPPRASGPVTDVDAGNRALEPLAEAASALAASAAQVSAGAPGPDVTTIQAARVSVTQLRSQA